ncbi:hypothetical protein HPP92_002404 [Vanilla planifolia]|uniref:Uncharacterized protein n=1 Tax=Vanilla planifolia TaxID=51239 RepID=A0A835RVU3_VANPL|nr:hypothetical protein HPP92_002404 [Vanilla planifolia]
MAFPATAKWLFSSSAEAGRLRSRDKTLLSFLPLLTAPPSPPSEAGAAPHVAAECLAEENRPHIEQTWTFLACRSRLIGGRQRIHAYFSVRIPPRFLLLLRRRRAISSLVGPVAYRA